MNAPEKPPLKIGLFATCLVDLLRPSVGFAAARLLTQAGCDVHVPTAQTCCGQPAYNSGDAKDARALAINVIAAFENFDYVVAPSGSCAGMIREHYPALFKDDGPLKARAESLAAKTHELLSFLVDVIGMDNFDARFDARATYHDSCAALREMGVHGQARALMQNVQGLALHEITGEQEKDSCCGFGGLFSVKYADISTRIVDAKIEAIEKTGADVLLGGDLGCLINIAGRLQRRGSKISTRHLAEVLAGTHLETPPIGEKG
ncbi:MAG: (Fe-S)-binding protein [Rhodospirillaceae bacterium]|nr:(Fe-S)-binding protein [Rhodospirillaceae bacterium]